jgi:DNA-binding transcriptional LysR family regulator
MAQLENFRLKVFRTVAEHLSFHKAAEHLFLTQPAVTQQVKALEDELGVRLFDRTPKGVLLTEQGSLLLQYAQKAAALTAEAAEKLASGDGKLSGEFALGVSTTIAQYVLPRLIGALNHLGRLGLTVTLFLIGTRLNKATLKRVGVRPLLQGITLWIIVGAGTLSLILFHWIEV